MQSEIKVNVTFKYAWYLRAYIALAKTLARVGINISLRYLPYLFERGCTCEVHAA